MKYVFILSLVLIWSAVASCDAKDRTFSNVTLSVTGKVGDILVVCDKSIWESELKTCLDSNLTQFIMPYYPDVVTFELIHKTPERFTKGVKRYRNTMFITIDPEMEGDKGKIERRNDVWATGQLVIDIKAPNYNELIRICQKGLDQVHDIFDENEWRRIMKQHQRVENTGLDKKIAKNFGIHLDLPDGARLLWHRENFFRIQFPEMSRPIEFVGSGGQDAGNIYSGVMIYQYDYLDSTQLALKKLLMARDTMLKYNVPSEIEGMYMGTQYVKMVYPEANWSTNASKSIKGIEMRGMFQFTGNGQHGVGGAFWAFHFVHPKTNKLVCISGYVDAPSTTSWTHPLRDCQAVFKSVEIL